VFCPSFDPEVHGEPEEILPMMAIGPVYRDGITGIELVRAVSLHDSPDMAGADDLFLEEDDGGLAGWVAALWSHRELPLSVASGGRRIARVSPQTVEIIKGYRAGTDATRFGRVGTARLTSLLDPRLRMRKRLLAATEAFSRDLSARRAWKVEVVDYFAPLMRDVAVRMGVDDIPAVSFGAVLRQIVEPKGHAAADTFSDFYQQQCSRFAEERLSGGHRHALLALLESERYIRTGHPIHRDKAAKHRAGAGDVSFAELREAARGAADVSFAVTAMGIFAVAPSWVEDRQAVGWRAGPDSDGEDETYPAVKLERRFHRFRVVITVVRRPDALINLEVSVEDTHSPSLPRMKAVLLRASESADPSTGMSNDIRSVPPTPHIGRALFERIGIDDYHLNIKIPGEEELPIRLSFSDEGDSL
jgi:hypothetical protein